MYLASNTVKAFPLAKSRSSLSLDITSRIFYEQNVSNLIRQLSSIPGFVISGDVDVNGCVVDILKLNIYGYYFEILPGRDSNNNAIPTSLIPDDATDSVYVGIQLSEPYTMDVDGNQVQVPIEIIGQDINGQYLGLCFATSLNPENNIHLIGFKLLEATGSGANKKWRLTDESHKKFDFIKDLNITFIDGKN